MKTSNQGFYPQQFVQLLSILLDEYINYKILQEQEKTKREKIKKDIEIIKILAKKRRNIINKLLDNKLEEREKILDNLLKEIDQNINNIEILRILLVFFSKYLTSPIITKEEMKNIIKLSLETYHNKKTIEL